jgi:hypothetical protein
VTHPPVEDPGSEAPVEVTVDEQGALAISDRVGGESVPRDDTVWPAGYRLVRVGGKQLPACRVCGHVAPPDLETHPSTHEGAV